MKIYLGDSLEILQSFEEDSIDAVVTDPPYGLKFMGKKWDYNVPSVELWQECLRVLKPGGYLLSFAGTRTYHRMVVNIEDAGFEIRDMIAWVYGSGFPKSLDVSKAIDKAAGAEREEIGTIQKSVAGMEARGTGNWCDDDYEWKSEIPITAPATEAAKQWHGWGTALKPAHEPIVVARKPFKGTVAANVVKHGTGGLNIDGCRVGTLKDVPASPSRTKGNSLTGSIDGSLRNETGKEDGHNPNIGRWPANLIHDGSEEVMELFPYTKARFFYCAKINKKDRGEGNTHPTVKPTDLMRYLCRLVTQPGGVVLDPFMGSGSTGKAAALEDFDFIGIEVDTEYFKMAGRRLK
jgi:site-specific DNA-methyltransferase (adenine-specific)